jgi:hypothetical protein
MTDIFDFPGADELKDQERRNTIVVEDETLREGFVQLPNRILRDPDLSPAAKLVYAGILSYAWRDESAWPGQARLAADLGVHHNTVWRMIKELQERGYLTVKRRGLGKTNIYTLTARTKP